MPTLEANVTVAYEEVMGSPSESYRTQGASAYTIGSGTFQATRTLQCAWAERTLLAQQLTGAVASVGGQILVIEPARYPDFTLAFVTGVTISGFGKPSDSISGLQIDYTYARLQVTYEVPQFDFSTDVGDQVLVEERLSGFAEFLTLPSRQLYWDASQAEPLALDESPGKLVRGAEWNYTILQVPTLPAGLFDLIGKTNTSAVVSQTLNVMFAAETLLMGPLDPTRFITVNGASAWKLPISISYKPQGWNKYFRAGNMTTPQSLYNAAGTELVGANGVYTRSDFTIIPGIVAP